MTFKVSQKDQIFTSLYKVTLGNSVCLMLRLFQLYIIYFSNIPLSLKWRFTISNNTKPEHTTARYPRPKQWPELLFTLLFFTAREIKIYINLILRILLGIVVGFCGMVSLICLLLAVRKLRNKNARGKYLHCGIGFCCRLLALLEIKYLCSCVCNCFKMI